MSAFLSQNLLIFVRHAETEANVGGMLVGRGHSPFTNAGLVQMEHIVAKFSAMNVDRVYTSPAERTAVLATRIAAASGAPNAIADDRLQEIHFGSAEGLLYSDLPKGGVSLDADSYSSPIVEGGESRVEVDRRVASFLDDVRCLGGVTVVVSHGGPLRSAIAHSIGLDARDCWSFHVDNGAVVTVSLHDGMGVLEEFVVAGKA